MGINCGSCDDSRFKLLNGWQRIRKSNTDFVHAQGFQNSDLLRTTPRDSGVKNVIGKMLSCFTTSESNWVPSASDVQFIHDRCRNDFEVLVKYASNLLRSKSLRSDEWNNPSEAY